MYGAVDVEVEVVLSKFAAYSWMGWVEAVIATWVTRIGSGQLTMVTVKVGHSSFTGF